VERIPTVAARQRVKKDISKLLSQLDLEDRRVVAEEVLDEILVARRTGEKPPPVLARTPAAARTGIVSTVELPKKSVADRIVDWCQAHPAKDGMYTIREVVRQFDLEGKNRHARIFSAVLRASPKSDRTPPKHPRFEWIGDGGKFRLYSGGNA